MTDARQHRRRRGTVKTWLVRANEIGGVLCPESEDTTSPLLDHSKGTEGGTVKTWQMRTNEVLAASYALNLKNIFSPARSFRGKRRRYCLKLNRWEPTKCWRSLMSWTWKAFSSLLGYFERRERGVIKIWNAKSNGLSGRRYHALDLERGLRHYTDLARESQSIVSDVGSTNFGVHHPSIFYTPSKSALIFWTV